MTNIERLQKTGILRAGTPKRGFRHKYTNGRKIGADDLRRIKRLRIPPAWKEVAINPAPAGRIQAVGKDAVRALAISLS
jgi:DNA topoisomerase-1